MSGFDQLVTFLPVTDLEESARFYHEILGLPLVLDQGDCLIFRVAADSFIGICNRPEQVDPGSVIVTLVSEDVDQHHRALVKAGIHCDQPPQHSARYNVYHAFYRDPDGFVIEIQRFVDPAWPSVRGHR